MHLQFGCIDCSKDTTIAVMCALIKVFLGMVLHGVFRVHFITNFALLRCVSVSVILELLVVVTMPVTDFTTELPQHQLCAVNITNNIPAHRMQQVEPRHQKLDLVCNVSFSFYYS